jgi:hypothetical protein
MYITKPGEPGTIEFGADALVGGRVGVLATFGMLEPVALYRIVHRPRTIIDVVWLSRISVKALACCVGDGCTDNSNISSTCCFASTMITTSSAIPSGTINLISTNRYARSALLTRSLRLSAALKKATVPLLAGVWFAKIKSRCELGDISEKQA